MPTTTRRRRRKCDKKFREAADEILSKDFLDSKGNKKKGVDFVAMNLFKIASDPKNKQAVAASKLLIQLGEKNERDNDELINFINGEK